jgi:potassium-transporting ATPase KdpC subunit
MKKQIKTSFLFTAISTIALGVIYPLLLSGTALIIPKFSQPSLLEHPIEPKDLFHGRPSMMVGSYSGASNLAITSQALSQQVRARIENLTKDAPGVLIPKDLLFASASGFDPDISPEAAKFQALRIATQRNIHLKQIHDLINQHTDYKLFSFIGTDHVNVMTLNPALEKLVLKH